MPFTVEDFRDLVQLLEERPQWRAEMRRLVLSDEYLAVPEQIAGLQRETAELRRDLERLRVEVEQLRVEVAELRRDLEQLRVEVEQLRVEVAELRRDLERLRVEVAELRRDLERLRVEVAELRRDLERLRVEVAELRRDMEHRFNHVQVQLDKLTDDVGQLKGENLERRYRENAHAYFGRLISKGRVLGSEKLSDLLEDAVHRGDLSQSDRYKVALADLVMRGRWLTDGREVMVLAEISSLVDLNDVRRAVDRAALLAKLGTPVVPVVAGTSVTERAADMARSQQVWQMLNGRIIEPPGDSRPIPDRHPC